MMFGHQLHYAEPGLTSGKHPTPAALTRMDNVIVHTSHRPSIPSIIAHPLHSQFVFCENISSCALEVGQL
jgi:hypothetical protein